MGKWTTIRTPEKDQKTDDNLFTDICRMMLRLTFTKFKRTHLCILVKDPIYRLYIN